MISRLFLRFWRSTSGAVPFEAVWAGLFLSFLITPTIFLMRVSETHLTATWGQRTAAMNEAMNNNCTTTGSLSPLNATTINGVNSITGITCSETEGSALPANKRFWKRMETVMDPHFNNFTRDLENHGDIKVVQGSSAVSFTRNVNLGDPNPMAGLIMVPKISQLQVPSADYWLFTETHWKEGHDKRFYSSLPGGSGRTLYRHVFPSR